MDRPEIAPISNQGEVNFLDYLTLLAKYSRIIIFSSLAVTIITYLFLFVSPNTYQATLRMLPPQQQMTLSAQMLDSLGGGKPMAGSGGLGGMAANLLGKSSSQDIYLGMLKSNTILDRVIERFNLREKVKFIEDARLVVSSVTIITVSKGGMITIEVKDKVPKQAAEIANAFAEELDKLLQELSVQEARGRLAFLEKEGHQASINLAKAEDALRTFSEQSSVIQIDAQTKGMLQYVANLRASIDAKEVQIQVLRQQATPFNYDLIRQETELKGLKEKLRAAETEFEKCVGDVCLPTSKTPGLGLEYLRLYRQVKFQEHNYDFFIKMAALARMEMVKDVAMVQMVDRAKPPEKRINTRLFPALLSGIVTCFILILGLFFREYLEQSKMREDNLPRYNLLAGYLEPWLSSWRRLCAWIKERFKINGR